MFKLKKISLFLALAFVVSLFCIPKAYALDTNTNSANVSTTTGSAISISSLRGIKTPNSYESNMTLKINLKGVDLSKEEAEVMSQLEPFLSNLVIDLNMKATSNLDKTLADTYVKASTTIMGMPLNFEIWVKTDNTGKTPKYKMVMKLPKGLDILPTGKEYMVFDSDTIGAQSSSPSTSLSQAAMTEMTAKLQNIIFTLCDELDAKFKLVNDKGELVVKTPVGDQPAHSFEIKLDDKSFKEVLNYTVNNLLQNKNFMSMINDLVKSLGLPDTDSPTMTDKEINEMIKGFNEFYDKFKDIKLIGDKGIVCNYAITPENYVAKSSGIFDIVIDVQGWSKLFDGADKLLPSASSTSNTSKSKYSLTVEFENIIYNINKTETINLPTLTKTNSTTMTEMLTGLTGTATKTTPKVVDKKPAAPKPTTPKPVVKKPVTTKPVVKKPVTTTKNVVKPTVKKPAVVSKKITIKKPVTKKPVVKKPVTSKAKGK